MLLADIICLKFDTLLPMHIPKFGRDILILLHNQIIVYQFLMHFKNHADLIQNHRNENSYEI